MKLSELIQNLQEVIAKTGDVDITFSTPDKMIYISNVIAHAQTKEVELMFDYDDIPDDVKAMAENNELL